MIFSYFMPTRIIWGDAALADLAPAAVGLGTSKVLVVTDPVIEAQRFCADAIDALRDEGLTVSVFNECGIDARLSHIDRQAARCREEGIGTIVCIGGGSVMCTGKGIAIVATNGTSLRDHLGAGNFSRPALPMVMVPTTAGSGSEVSQFTIVKDEERHLKLLAGGPLSFPNIAILDPVVLTTLPERAAVLPAVDALTHAIEAYLTELATPLTDALALEAAALQAGSMRASILEGDVTARGRNLLASAMSNIACGNARLGHSHALSLPLEGHLDLAHPLGVGTLTPWTMQFNAEVAPDKGRRLAEALGADTRGLTPTEAIAAGREALLRLYDDIGFPRYLTAEQLPPERCAEMARLAVPGLYAPVTPECVDERTFIASPSIRRLTVAEATSIYERCLEG